ncbi:DotI/IcmL/TraM family protein [Candidatus Coxiella mudrowiae]|nr:DotI/IcmL/TraM family protein [Candidatus Coxiella mudrowiae]
MDPSTHPPQPTYFATTADGRIIMLHPLNDPVLPGFYAEMGDRCSAKIL